MKKKNLIITVITIILLIIAVFLVLKQRSGTFGSRQKDFAVADTASITKVFLADKDNNTILLERKASGYWLLNGAYRARNSGINMLFETFVNLIPKYPVPKKGQNSVIMQMAARSVKVEIYQQVYRIQFLGLKLFRHERLTKTYFVGGATQDNMGTFMLMEGADVPFVVHLLGFRGFVGPRYSTVEKEWRDHTVFREQLNNIASIIMEIPSDPEKSFKINNVNGEVKLLRLPGMEPVDAFDTLKLLNFMTAFADLRYEALLNDINAQRKDSIIHSTPKYILTLINTKGDTTMMKTFYKPNDEKRYDMEGKLYVMDLDRAYALVNQDRDFVLIQYFVFDKALKPLSYFLPDQ
jgi:hypothetical protein